MNRELSRLSGTWRLDATDRDGRQTYGDVTLKFGKDQSLLYIVHESDRDQTARLAFHLEPGFIVTDQPSAPHQERTAYEFTEDGKLILTLGQERSRYIRVSSP